jgi:hypothetical protein
MGSEYFSAPKKMAKMGAEYIFPLMPSGKKEIVMRLLIRLVSLAVAAYSCYSGAVTGEWKASIAIISLCALMFLITFISKTRGGTPGSQSDGASAIYTPSSSSSSSCSSDGGGGDC